MLERLQHELPRCMLFVLNIYKADRTIEQREGRPPTPRSLGGIYLGEQSASPVQREGEGSF